MLESVAQSIVALVVVEISSSEYMLCPIYMIAESNFCEKCYVSYFQSQLRSLHDLCLKLFDYHVLRSQGTLVDMTSQTGEIKLESCVNHNLPHFTI